MNKVDENNQKCLILYGNLMEMKKARYIQLNVRKNFLLSILWKNSLHTFMSTMGENCKKYIIILRTKAKWESSTVAHKSLISAMMFIYALTYCKYAQFVGWKVSQSITIEWKSQWVKIIENVFIPLRVEQAQSVSRDGRNHVLSVKYRFKLSSLNLTSIYPSLF